MVVMALLLPVLLLLMLFGLDAFENFLFPPPPAPSLEETHQSTTTARPDHEE
ncbi:hypothetical protein [Streptomyces sp. NWU339]|uniref:hypothetical protein n=1 Tax=Streptomyces sp. NWU339 TaxID=2185284 RepID=UPI0015E7FD5F|nr:hypothetical protein [Streptomyces sp. NWU339]